MHHESDSAVPPQQGAVPDESPGEPTTPHYQEDAYMFGNMGKKLRSHLRKLGASMHYPPFSRPQEEPETAIEPGQAGDLGRLVWSAFRIPFYGIGCDEDGRRTIPAILSLVKVAICDSDDTPATYSPNTSFTIRLCYGQEMRWTIHRRILDFVWLHSILSFRHLQGHLDCKLPDFPNQLSYLVDTTMLKRLSKEERYDLRQRTALERRLALESYLNALLLTMNMQLSATEVFEFLEISRMSLMAAEPGNKYKEGYLRNRIYDTRPRQHWCALFCACLPADCLPADCLLGKRHFQTKWFLIRSSYIAYVDTIDQTTPSDVLLCDKHFHIRVENELSNNPLKPFSVTIYNGAKRLQVRPESNSQMRYWLDDLRHLADTSIWCLAHRFGSFGPVRRDCRVEWLVDGDEFYSRLVQAILDAKEELYIHGWWVSPELYLARPASAHPHMRLDRLLQKKAREGVKIYIVIFKEVSMALSINSYHTKVSLERLHPNIRVQRHPDHLSGVLYWAHHEKLVVADQKVAFIGGLDLCFGRYDVSTHPLTDYNPADSNVVIWNGLDYANPRVRDFRNVSQFTAPLVDRRIVPRMPWHDVHCVVYGPPARDAARHFIQRWNFIKQQKSMHKEAHIPFLLPKPDFTPAEIARLGCQGSQRIQIVRSCAEWSVGLAPEISIYDAYLSFIENAVHFIMVENQFFISKSADRQSTPVRNRIASAIFDRIIRAHEEGSEFRVFVFLPLLPAFESPVHRAEASSVRMIMQGQYSAISKGPYSILGQLLQRGIKAENYISFLSLRKYDRLDGRHVTEQVYIHSKLLIVDDRVACLGSANINDRSLLGVRDSEIAVVVEDADLIDVQMNGEPFQVGRKVQELRKRLMQEHLGLSPSDPRTDDPVIASFYFGVVRHQASLNTQIYRELFHCVPDDCVDSWEEYRRFTEAHRIHVMDPNLGIDSMENIKCIKGNVVLFPTQFLRKEDLAASMLTPEYLLPIEVYL